MLCRRVPCFIAFVPQIGRYIRQSLGLQQFCPAAQPSHERRCSLQRYHFGEEHTNTEDMSGECGGNEENVSTCVVAGCFWVLLTSARSLVLFYSAPDLLFKY